MHNACKDTTPRSNSTNYFISCDSDSYDLLLSVAAFLPGHLDHACLEELIRVTKPGKKKIRLDMMLPLLC